MTVWLKNKKPQTLLEALTFRKGKTNKQSNNLTIICPRAADILMVEPEDLVSFCSPYHMSAFMPFPCVPKHTEHILNLFFKSFTITEHRYGYYVVNHLVQKHCFVGEDWRDVVEFLDNKVLALAGSQVFENAKTEV